jgi:aromatic ring-opening dioxygenase LigB subunit
MVEQAKADSWWQMLMLHGAMPGWTGRLISYEVPTYFGMLTAAYSPPAS